jgi:hypothetical protein
VRLGNDNNSETTVVSVFVSDVGAASLRCDSLTSGWCPPASDSFVHVLRKDYSKQPCGLADQAWRCSCKAWDQACTRCPSAWPTRLFQNHPCKSCCSFFSSHPFLPQVRTSWWARRLYSLSMYVSCVPSASLIPSSKRSCSRVDGVLILETLYSCIHIGV